MPVFVSLGRYRAKWLPRDLLAGLSVWAILVPEALAYAAIAGVSPVVGLYAAPGALIFYAALGSSRHLVVAPMAATAALSAAAVGELATSGSKSFVALTAALGIATGLAALIAGVLRLGFVANFISAPVLKGFIVGLALTIIVGQVPKLLGIESGSGDFFEKLWHVLTNLSETDGLTLIVAAASFAVVIVSRRWMPMFPGSLLAVALGIAAAHLFGLSQHGVEVVGPIKGGLPSFGLPHVPAADYLKLGGSAIGIMLVGFVEGLGAARTYAEQSHDTVDANRELVALGAANLAAGLSSGMVVNGSLSKTAVNHSSGARTQVSNLLVALLTIVTLAFLTGLFTELPTATLAAIVVAAVIELVDVPSLVALYHVYSSRLGRIYGFAARVDLIAALATLIGVLVFDTLPGLFIGIGVSFVLLLYRSSRPNLSLLGRVPGASGQWADVANHPENEQAPGVAVLRIESPLYFTNAEHVRLGVLAAVESNNARRLVLDLEAVPTVDVTAARMLEGLAAELGRRSVQLAVARDIGQVRDVLAGTDGRDGLGPLYRSVDDAVRATTCAEVATPPRLTADGRNRRLGRFMPQQGAPKKEKKR